jgi:hypothetical protein
MTMEEDRQKETITNRTRIFHIIIEKIIERNHDREIMIILNTKSIIVLRITVKVLTMIDKEMIAALTIIEIAGKAILVVDTIITIIRGKKIAFLAINIAKAAK